MYKRIFTPSLSIYHRPIEIHVNIHICHICITVYIDDSRPGWQDEPL